MGDIIEPSFNLRLIEAVRHSRCLYDSTDRQYRNMEYKSKVWNRLVSVLGFNGDPRMLAARWKQLRDKYGKEKRKQKYGAEKSTWQYFKQLHFLDPHMTDRTEVSPSRKDTPEVYTAVANPQFAPNLIEEVRKHPCLYDIRNPKYRQTEWRNRAWESIICNLNFPGSVQSLYKQWKKHRDRYVREKKRIKMQADLGMHEASGWEYYDRMTWIDPFLDERASSIRRHTTTSNHEDISEYGDVDDELGFMFMEKRGNGDILLDGDSAFSASIVSDLRNLPEHARTIAKQQIELLLESGKMSYI